MKRLIFLLHMPKGNKNLFHVRNYFFLEMDMAK